MRAGQRVAQQWRVGAGSGGAGRRAALALCASRQGKRQWSQSVEIPIRFKLSEGAEE